MSAYPSSVFRLFVRKFITYSASATDANYCLGMVTAKANLLDPVSWFKSPVPVFKSDPAASQFGPGHNSFTTPPDGKTDILVYHDKNYEKIQGDPLRNRDRATRAQVIHWRPHGTPDFGTPSRTAPVAKPSLPCPVYPSLSYLRII